MRNHLVLFILFIGMAVAVNSCGLGIKSKAAEPFADKFYAHLMQKDYDAIIEMVDVEALKISPVEDWKAVLTQKEANGELKSVKKKTGFHSQYKNGQTYVSLKYTCEYDKFKLHEKLIFVQRGEKFKIFSYEYNQDESKLTAD